jgi:hypothetical protein
MPYCANVVNVLLNWLVRVLKSARTYWLREYCEKKSANKPPYALPDKPEGHIGHLLEIGSMAFQYDVNDLLDEIVEQIQQYVAGSESYPPEYVTDWYSTVKRPVETLAAHVMKRFYDVKNHGRLTKTFANALVEVMAGNVSRMTTHFGNGFHAFNAITRASEDVANDIAVGKIAANLMTVSQSAEQLKLLRENINKTTTPKLNKIKQILLTKMLDAATMHNSGRSHSIEQIIIRGTYHNPNYY